MGLWPKLQRLATQVLRSALVRVLSQYLSRVERGGS